VCLQVFKPDKMNGFDVQTEAEAMLERQRRDIMPRVTNTPRTPATPSSGLRFVSQLVSLLSHVPRVGFGAHVCYRCRISPPRFLAECRKRRLNQGSFVSLFF